MALNSELSHPNEADKASEYTDLSMLLAQSLHWTLGITALINSFYVYSVLIIKSNGNDHHI